MDQNSQQAAAGWYPDPDVPDQTRWWDGTAWTEHVNAAVAAPIAPTPPTPASSVSSSGQWSTTPLPPVSSSDRARTLQNAAEAAQKASPVAPTIAQPTVTARVAAAGRTNSPRVSQRLADGKNTAASASLWLGLLALLINPLLLVGAGAVVLSLLAQARNRLWVRAGHAAVRPGKAGWGLALGLLATLISIIVTSQVLSRWWV